MQTRCWNWTGAIAGKGHGRFWVGGKLVPAHRYSYELATGTDPGKLQIDHRCHNERCVRPDHLRAVTPAQNLQNRRGAQRGSASGVRGVRKFRNRWRAEVQHNGKRIQVDSFAALADAEAAVIAKRNELFSHNDLDRPAAAVRGRSFTVAQAAAAGTLSAQVVLETTEEDMSFSFGGRLIHQKIWASEAVVADLEGPFGTSSED
jgi:HNH endonuclease